SSNKERPIIDTRFVFFKSAKFLAPIPNIVIFNSNSICSITFNTSSTDTVAALSNVRAYPTTSAPIVIAFAASSPVFIPPLATKGAFGSLLLTETRQSFVGIPQLLNASAAASRNGSAVRSFSTCDQDVPPAPATSIYCTPTLYNLSASVPSILDPTSFTPTGTERFLHTSSIFGNKSSKFNSPPSWTISCKLFKCNTRESASVASTIL